MKPNKKKDLQITVLDLLCLLDNIHRAAQDKNTGFEDAEHTLESITAALAGARRVWVPKVLIESALWSCNLLSERNKFRHFRGLTYSQFEAKVVGPALSFDRRYNFIKGEPDDVE